MALMSVETEMEEMGKLIDEARKSCNDSKYEDAESCYRKALDICLLYGLKEKIDVCQLLADLLHKQGKLADAEDSYEQCIGWVKEFYAINKKEAMLKMKLGVTVSKQGGFAEAECIFLDALKIIQALHTDSSADYEVDEDVALIYNNLAEVMCHLGEKTNEMYYRSIAKNIELTLETIESAKDNKIPTEHIIRRYIRPCAEEIKGKYNCEKVYMMSKGKRGFCLILNNRQFNYGTRDGSEIDEANLKNVFTQLNFDVQIQNNIAGKDFPAIVEFWVNKSNHYGAFVLVLMSHGNEKNEILGSDDKSVLKHNILRKLYNASQLQMKPRLAIIQACRGRDCNTTEKKISSSVMPSSVTTSDKVGDKTSRNTTVHGTRRMDAKPSIENRIGCCPDDCCTMNATEEGFVAYRDPIQGSPFIAAVTEALFLYSHEKHMKEISKEVKNLMKDKYGTFNQRPDIKDWFHGKEFYFFPEFDEGEM